jgi:phosphoglycolate phosphatase-like HAD superfamily hydrolase
MKSFCYIFDIDGTLADCSHRRHFVENKPKDWEAFFAACVDDKPIEHMVRVAQHLNRDRGAHMVFVSGRPERIRQQTYAWLVEHVGGYISALYMRADGDRRDDTVVKYELLQRLKTRFYPIMVFDDRKRVVDMWRANQIPCAQVAEGDF